MNDLENFPKMLAVAVVVLDGDNNILLHPRDKEPDQGKWQYVAGYVQPGERLKDTAQRKLKEKLNITELDSIEFTGKYYDDLNRHPGTYCIPLLFIARVQRENVSTPEPAQWFTPEEAAELDLALDNKKILADLQLI